LIELNLNLNLNLNNEPEPTKNEEEENVFWNVESAMLDLGRVRQQAAWKKHKKTRKAPTTPLTAAKKKKRSANLRWRSRSDFVELRGEWVNTK
jgi:hypothetical protein